VLQVGQLLIWPYLLSFSPALVRSGRENLEVVLACWVQEFYLFLYNQWCRLLIREYLLLKCTYERELTQSAGKDSTTNTLINPCLQNLACPDLKKWQMTESCLIKHDIARKQCSQTRALKTFWVQFEIGSWKSQRQLSQEANMSRLCFWGN
jgi:hypothetical protein